MNKRVVLSIVVAVLLWFSGSAMADPLSAALTIDPIANLSSDHLVVTLSGTYRCGPLPQPQGGFNFAFVMGALAQASGREIAGAALSFEPLCDDLAHPFELGVHAQNIPWHGGKARLTANLSVQSCQNFPCETASSSVDQQISIRGGGQ